MTRHKLVKLFSYLAIVVLFVGLSPSSASANVFRWANDGPVVSMDPHTRRETFLLSFLANIYEPLVRGAADMSFEPGLATEWTQIEPTIWRFKLRKNVVFHDGSPFSAHDVVFSIQRARHSQTTMNSVVSAIRDERIIDSHTVDLVTDKPIPLLPNIISNLLIMPRNWSVENGSAITAAAAKTKEIPASRIANGTGPFRLKRYQPDGQTVLSANPTWWNTREHNLDEVVFSVIPDDEARVRALLMDQLDMILSLPPDATVRIAANPGLRTVITPEIRTLYLAMDQSRDILHESSVKTTNPFKDLRVRKAFYMAIDNQLIRDRVMRSFSIPTGSLFGKGVRGFNPALNSRLAPVDPIAAKALLAEAGYPDGFALTLDCPNDRYVNDEKICHAVAGMLDQIGIKVKVNAQTRSKFFAKIDAPVFNTSFLLIGWAPSTMDAHDVLYNILHCRDGVAGQGNNGGYCNRTVDGLIDKINLETNRNIRQGLIDQVIKIAREEFAYIPLHQQVILSAAKRSIDIAQRADGGVQLFRIKMN